MVWKGLAYYVCWFFAGEEEANRLWGAKKKLVRKND